MGCNTSKTTTNNVVVGSGGSGGGVDTNNNNNNNVIETKTTTNHVEKEEKTIETTNEDVDEKEAQLVLQQKPVVSNTSASPTTNTNNVEEEKTIVYSPYTQAHIEDIKQEAQLILQRTLSNTSTTNTGGSFDGGGYGDYSNMYRHHTIHNDDEPYCRYKASEFDIGGDDDGYNKYSGYEIEDNVEFEGTHKVYVHFRHQMVQNAPPSSAIMNDEKEKEADKVLADAEYERAKTNFNHHNTDKYLNDDWNARIQEIFDRNVATPQDQRKRTNDITNLTNEFTEHIQVIAKAIIMRKIYPQRPALVEPTMAKGGRAGGEKFIVGHVLYKFATDWQQIYGNDDLEAEKASLLELKAMNALINEDIRLIHTTLVSLYRYRGYCVYAIALAPIKQLIYGSEDAGVHVADASELPGVRNLMYQVAESFHLRPHKVIERSTKIVKELCHPIDVECHIGTDGRLYLFDLARESVPTPPVKGVRHSFLTRHFRIELLKQARVVGLPSLSSDSYSNFSHASERKQDEANVNVVFKYLLTQIMPSLASKLDQMQYEQLSSSPSSLSSIFHAHGVNMRYIPTVAKNCKNDEIRRYLCEEMFIRYFKTYFRHKWNKNLDCSDSWLLSQMYDVLKQLFNNNNNNKWPTILIEDVKRKYNDITVDTNTLSNELKAIANGGYSFGMFLRLLRACDISYDSTLPLENAQHDLYVHYKTWQMQPTVVTLKAPEFVSLNKREKQLKDEIKLREEADLPIIEPLKGLLGLYRVWSAEEAQVSKANGINVANQLLLIVNSAEPSIEMGWVLWAMYEFYRHFGVVQEQRNVAEQMLNMFRELLSAESDTTSSKYREMQRGLGQSNHSLGLVCWKLTEYTNALAYYTEALGLYKIVHTEVSEKYAAILNNMGLIYQEQGKYDKSLEYHDKSLSIKRKLAKDDDHVATSLMNIAIVYDCQGKFNKALQYHQNALEIYRRHQGNEHVDVALALRNIANVYYSQGKYKESLEYNEESLRINRKLLGNDHSKVASSLMSVANVYFITGEHDKALEYHEEALAIFKRQLGDEHLSIADVLINIANVYAVDNMLEKALNYYNEALEMYKKQFGDDHVSVADAVYNIGLIYSRQNQHEKAYASFNQCQRIRIAVLPPDHPDIASINRILQYYQ